MASVKNKILAEIENIEKVLVELEKVRNKPNKELVVLVGNWSFSSKYLYGDGKYFETNDITSKYNSSELYAK